MSNKREDEVLTSASKSYQKHVFAKIKPQTLKQTHDGKDLPTILPIEKLIEPWRRKFFKDDNHLARSAVRRWTTNIKLLCKLVPPRVQAANILLGHNGWPTPRRTGRSSQNCPFCKFGLDDVSHYVKCPTIRATAGKIRGPLDYLRQRSFHLLQAQDTDEVVIASLINFAVYEVCNIIRHSKDGPLVANEGHLIDHASTAARSHPQAFRVWMAYMRRNNPSLAIADSPAPLSSSPS